MHRHNVRVGKEEVAMLLEQEDVDGWRALQQDESKKGLHFAFAPQEGDAGQSILGLHNLQERIKTQKTQGVINI